MLNIIINLIDKSINFKEALKTFETNFSILRYNYIIMLFILLASWYTFTASSSAFITIVDIGNNMINSINELFSESSQGYYILTNSYSLSRDITKFISLIAQFFIFIGIVYIISNFKKIGKLKEYFLLCIAWFIFDIFGIAVPFFASSLNTLRLYFITLIFLSPVLIIGFEYSIKTLSKFLKVNIKKSLQVIIIFFLIAHFVFNSGVAFYIAGEESKPFIDSDTPFPKWSKSERFSAKFIEKFKNDNPIYGDQNSILLFLGTLCQPFGPYKLSIDSSGKFSGDTIPKESYLFINSWVNENQKIEILLPFQEKIYLNMTNFKIYNIFLKSNNIYTTQNCNYYYKIN